VMDDINQMNDQRNISNLNKKLMQEAEEADLKEINRQLLKPGPGGQ
jgi:hypothetical protein